MAAQKKPAARSHLRTALLFTLLAQLVVAYFEIYGLSLPRISGAPVPSTPAVIVVTAVSPLPEFARMETTQYPLDHELFSYDLNSANFPDSDDPVPPISTRHNLPTLSDSSNISQNLPLHLLRSGQHSRVADLIINDRVGFIEVEPSTGYNLLHYLARSYHYCAMDVVLIWMDSPDNLDPDDFFNKYLNKKSIISGDTPLHLAVTHPNNIFAYLMVNLLLRHGADPLITNTDGRNPIDLAASYTSDPIRLKIINREWNLDSEIDDYLDCAFGGREGSSPPEDPIFWLIEGSTDKFGPYPRFDIIRNPYN